jgi:hypothetical protein
MFKYKAGFKFIEVISNFMILFKIDGDKLWTLLFSFMMVLPL